MKDTRLSMFATFREIVLVAGSGRSNTFLRPDRQVDDRLPGRGGRHMKAKMGAKPFTMKSNYYINAGA